MAYYEHKCENCGNIYIPGDEYCRCCNASLPEEEISDAELLDGMQKSDWHLFIEKNSSRYADIFARNEGKKIFLHMNWAAFFFGVTWMFYRKMYKYGIILLIISTVFQFAVTVGAVLAYKDDIITASNLTASYDNYVTAGDNSYFFANDGTVDIGEMTDSYREAQNIQRSVIIKIAGLVLFFSLLFNLLFALLADCIYRRYVTLNCGYSSGGTSILAAIGIIIFNSIFNEIFNALIFNPIINIIIK